MNKMGKVVIANPGTKQVLDLSNVNNAVIVKALHANLGLVYIGDVTLASGINGFPLDAGEVLVFENVGDLESLYVDAQAGGDGVAWIVLNL